GSGGGGSTSWFVLQACGGRAPAGPPGQARGGGLRSRTRRAEGGDGATGRRYGPEGLALRIEGGGNERGGSGDAGANLSRSSGGAQDRFGGPGAKRALRGDGADPDLAERLGLLGHDALALDQLQGRQEQAEQAAARVRGREQLGEAEGVLFGQP